MEKPDKSLVSLIFSSSCDRYQGDFSKQSYVARKAFQIHIRTGDWIAIEPGDILTPELDDRVVSLRKASDSSPWLYFLVSSVQAFEAFKPKKVPSFRVGQ